jgi:hypothetical protein
LVAPHFGAIFTQTRLVTLSGTQMFGFRIISFGKRLMSCTAAGQLENYYLIGFRLGGEAAHKSDIEMVFSSS